jgi:hypothetical protein
MPVEDESELPPSEKGERTEVTSYEPAIHAAIDEE